MSWFALAVVPTGWRWVFVLGAGGMIVAGVCGAFGYGAVFVYVGGAIFLAVLLMATLGERTANRSLGSIGERPGVPRG